MSKLRQHPNTFVRLMSVILCSCGLFACSGGGGGGSDDGSSLRRNDDTAIRIIHAALDGTPVRVLIGEELVQGSRYAEEKFYSRIDSGSQLLTIQRENTGQTVTELSASLEDDIEYSLLLYGNASTGTFQTRIVEDIVERPESGRALLRLINALEERNNLQLSVIEDPSATISDVDFGESSSFIETASGPLTLLVTTNSGAELARIIAEIPDRSDATLVIMGRSDLGVIFTRLYLDLD